MGSAPFDKFKPVTVRMENVYLTSGSCNMSSAPCEKFKSASPHLVNIPQKCEIKRKVHCCLASHFKQSQQQNHEKSGSTVIGIYGT